MKRTRRTRHQTAPGSVLVLVVVMMIILSIVGMGILTVSCGVQIRYARLKNETMAMLASEAGYEKAIFWMGQQGDIMGALNSSGASGTMSVGTSSCTYNVAFDSFVGSRPLFRITTVGTSGSAKRAVDVLVIQEIGGWSMAKCKVPDNKGSLVAVNFVDGETIDMDVHINDSKDTPDSRDIYIIGSPKFVGKVGMGEDRYADKGSDKYSDVINLFNGGIKFNQPAIRITDEAAVQSKLDRFRASTNPTYIFRPTATANISPLSPTPVNVTAHPGVQIEFYKDAAGVGMLRITNDCTVIGCQRSGNGVTNDWKVVPGSSGTSFTKYDVYAYHYSKNTTASIVIPVTSTYVRQTFGGKQSEPGGQIFVYGDVILGSNAYQMVLKGKLTIVAQRSGTSTDDGHIWIADKLMVDGTHYSDTDPCHPGLPALDNPNVLGLIAQGVVKVIDPGLAGYARSTSDKYPGPPPGSAAPYTLNDSVTSSIKHTYVPVGEAASTTLYDRKLPDPMVIEAAITVGGGGFGAENVADFPSNHGGRREDGESLSPSSERLTDQLVLHGSLCEVMRGIVGVSYGSQVDGFQKNYYTDERLLNGVLPGDLWFSGRYIPAPDGWKDYRTSN